MVTTISDLYFWKTSHAILQPDVSWSIKSYSILNPLALTSLRMPRSISPSAPLDEPAQLAPTPLLVQCVNQAILSVLISCNVAEELLE